MSINFQQPLRKLASLINHPQQRYVGDLPTRPLATEPLPQRQHVPNKSRIMRTADENVFKGKVSDAFSSLQFSKTVSLLFRVVILLALPVSILLVTHHVETQGHAASSANVLYGNYVPNGFQIGANLAKIEVDGGKGLAIIPWYLNWSSGFPAKTMAAIRGHGSIPELTWQPDGLNPNPILSKITNGVYDSYITKFAQGAKAWGLPFFLRFAHEMNGGYSWSEHAPGNSVGQYAPMWRHVHDIFTSVGATNVTWVWCPNIDSPTSTLAGLYPGDAYVDWTCMDGYNWGTSQPQWNSHWRTFSNLVTGTYKSFLQIAPSKPIMIGETASVEQGGNKAAWITDALTVQLPNNFPQIKAFVWFNQTNTPWMIETSPASQQAFASGIASSYYASNQYGTITSSPIQPPSGQTILPTSTPTGAVQTLTPTPTTPVTISSPVTTGSVIASDTFQRANQTFWGTASDGQRWGADANSNTSFFISGNTGKQYARGGKTYSAILGSEATNAQVLFSGSISGYVSSNIGAVLRYSDANNWYKASLNGDWLGRTSISIQKKVAGTNVTLARVPFNAIPGTNYSVRFQAIGTTLRAKVWITGSSEPANWMVTVNDSNLTTGYCGIRVLTQNGTSATYTSFTVTAL